MKHNLTLDEYLETPEERLAFTQIEEELKNDRRKNSPWSAEYYFHRGFTVEEAKEKINEFRLKRKKPKYHPSQCEFYINKGLSLEEAKRKVLYYREKIGKTPTLIEFIDQFGEKIGQMKWQKYCENLRNREDAFLKKYDNLYEGKIIRSIKKGFGDKKIVEIDYDDFKSYSRACRLITKLGLIIYRDRLDPSGEKLGREYGKNGWALDHKFSIYGGFYHKVNPFKIASFQNLQIIPKIENSQKSQFCVITKEEVESFPTLLDEECLSEETKEKIKNVFNRKS